MLPPKPHAPFDAWPTQLADEEAGLYGWHVPPNVFVLQYTDETYRFLTAQKVVHYTDSARAACAREIAANGGMVIIHDLRAVKNVQPEAQKYLDIAWKKLTAADLNAVYLLVGENMPKVVRMGLNIINVIAALTTGKTMTFVKDASEVLARHSISPPAPGLTFPGVKQP